MTQPEMEVDKPIGCHTADNEQSVVNGMRESEGNVTTAEADATDGDGDSDILHGCGQKCATPNSSTSINASAVKHESTDSSAVLTTPVTSPPLHGNGDACVDAGAGNTLAEENNEDDNDNEAALKIDEAVSAAVKSTSRSDDNIQDDDLELLENEASPSSKNSDDLNVTASDDNEEVALKGNDTGTPVPVAVRQKARKSFPSSARSDTASPATTTSISPAGSASATLSPLSEEGGVQKPKGREGRTHMSKRSRSHLTDEERVILKAPFAHGWSREIVYRQTVTAESKEKARELLARRAADVYYFTPLGQKLRSGPAIQEYLTAHKVDALTLENFSFGKYLVGDPNEIERFAKAQKRANPAQVQQHKSMLDAARVRKKKKLDPDTYPGYSTKHSTKTKPTSVKPIPVTQPKSGATLSQVSTSIGNFARSQAVGTPGWRATVPSLKTQKAVKSFPRSNVNSLVSQPNAIRIETRPDVMCSINCPGQAGVPPTLHCGVCLCLYHPMCVGFIGSTRESLFVCLKCADNVKRSGLPSSTEKGKMLGALSMPPSSWMVTKNDVGQLKSPVKSPWRTELGNQDASNTLRTLSNYSVKAMTGITSPSVITTVAGVIPPPPPLRAAPVSTTQSSAQQRGVLPAPPNIVYARGTKLNAPLIASVSKGQTVGYTQPPPPRLLVTTQHQQQQQQQLMHVGSINMQRPVISKAVASAGGQRQSMMSTSNVQILPTAAVRQQAVSATEDNLVPAMGAPTKVVPVSSQVMCAATRPPRLTAATTGQPRLLPANTPPLLASTQRPTMAVPGAPQPKVVVTGNQNYVVRTGTSLLPQGMYIIQPGGGAGGPPAWTAPASRFVLQTTQSVGTRPATKTVVSIAPNARNNGKVAKIGVPSVVRVAKARNAGINPAECFIQKLHVGFDVLLQIFSNLSYCDLLSVSCTCRLWHNIVKDPSLWKRVCLRGCKVSSWKQITNRMKKYGSDLRDVRLCPDSQKLWQKFEELVRAVPTLKTLDFGHVPSSLLQSLAEMTELRQQLQHLTADNIITNTMDAENLNSVVDLDLGKFGQLSSLRVLTLRGMIGIKLPEIVFSEGLAALAQLKQLRDLSLTNMREIPDNEFEFLGSMTDLVSLEIGDCRCWTSEIYYELGKLSNLKHLRLESGGEIPDIGLADSLSNLTELESLELVMFTIADTLSTVLPLMPKLRVLNIWPDVEQAAVVNMNVYNLVSTLPKLTHFDWGVACERDAGGQQPLQPIPFASVPPAALSKDSDAKDATDYMTVNQLIHSLCLLLPQTKIRVLRVPIVTTVKPATADAVDDR
ncbi:PREDICTED: uncharacterized protein LOC106805950 isoform X2 [Priapulus caudatus]|uniref:Uncharacterized protein LOC106805950 isoform X2 n=1 Tax=Priapulus caudatus TaxID=37621 RepID=A0ABM1DTG1_PRICU|nr:PREDICTED: uncharacterized protein LOC106805950 isoform X2 [Priapulus caudatus]